MSLASLSEQFFAMVCSLVSLPARMVSGPLVPPDGTYEPRDGARRVWCGDHGTQEGWEGRCPLCSRGTSDWPAGRVVKPEASDEAAA